jgi:hypothetical protein
VTVLELNEKMREWILFCSVTDKWNKVGKEDDSNSSDDTDIQETDALLNVVTSLITLLISSLRMWNFRGQGHASYTGTVSPWCGVCTTTVD